MARSFNGRASEKLYNDELLKIYNIIQHIADTPTDAIRGPSDAIDGALWLDRSSGMGDLKFKKNTEWETIFSDKFKMICEILSETQPIDPVNGQLWIDNGILMYYSGVNWIPVKSVNIDKQFNLSSFEQFLIVSPIEASGKVVIDPAIEVPQDKYTEEIFTIDNPIATYTLTKGDYIPNKNQVEVYINGSKLPKSFYTEVDSTSIEIKQLFGVVAENNNTVMIVYVNNISNTSIDTAHSQFLVPNVDLDRVFVNGLHDIPDSFYPENKVPENILLKYVSNICLEYPTDQLKGRTLSAVHINPKKLINAKKHLFKIDRNTKFIPLVEYNTEFYGVRNGATKLLTKKPSRDYESNSSGIILSDDIATTFDFIYSITYEFDNAATGEGTLTKQVVDLSKTTSIYIGDVEDESTISVFVQGLYLDPVNNYTYEDGYIKFALETNMDIGVIIWAKKEVGTITTLNASKKAVITPVKQYNKPLITVYGLTLNDANSSQQGVADYTVNKDGSYTLNNVSTLGLKYAIVETLNYSKTDPEVIDENMIIQKGVTKKDVDDSVFIDLSLSGLTELEINNLNNAILFVNGLLISKNDVVIDISNKRVTVLENNLKENMDFVLLRDDNNRYIFSNIVNFNTIPLQEKSDLTLVYIQNQLLTDANCVYTLYKPNSAGLQNELKLWTQGNVQTWMICNNNQWVEITDLDTIELLNTNTLNYASDDHTISILKDYGLSECVYYSYHFANSIESTLLSGIVKTKSTTKDYRVAYNHVFTPGKNNLLIWQNGLRQYPCTNNSFTDPNGYYELSSKEIASKGYFRLPNPIDGVLFYVVEKTEGKETQSYTYDILTTNDVVAGTKSTFKTNVALNSGHIRVFISGLRQPSNAFKIFDNHTIIIDGDILCGPNFPTENIIVNDELVPITRTHSDTIFIEAREDYSIKELTIPIRYNGQKEFLVQSENGDGIPESIINSADFIMIFVNGLAYGKDYTINKDRKSIILTNEEMTNKLTTKNFITFEWR